jgi:hypothetical protein
LQSFAFVFGARPAAALTVEFIVIARRQSGSTDGSAEQGRAELDSRCRRKFAARHCDMDDGSMPGSRVKRVTEIKMHCTAPSRLAEGGQPPASQ